MDKQIVPKVKITLSITGEDLDFDYLNLKLGVTATHVRKKEEFPMVSQNLGIARDEWVIETKKIQSYDVADIILQFIKKFKGKEGIIRSITEQCNAKKKLIVGIYMMIYEPPIISVPKECIEFTNAIGAEEIIFYQEIYEDEMYEADE